MRLEFYITSVFWKLKVKLFDSGVWRSRLNCSRVESFNLYASRERVPQGQQKHMSFSSFTQKLSEIYGYRYDDRDKTFFEIAGAMRNIKIRISR